METEDSTKEEFDANSNDLNVSSEENISQNPLVFSYGEKLTNSNLETLVTPAQCWKFFSENDFETMQVIARGAFGEVKKGKFKNEKKQGENGIVALKYPTCEIQDWIQELLDLSHEISCIIILHRNIVNYIGGLQLNSPPRIGVIMEFVSNNLRNFIEKDKRAREIKNQLKIAKQISSGMNFLHSLNPHILHRDLRTPNILINENLECKIADFGVSNNLIYKGLEHNQLYTILTPPECKEELGASDSKKFERKGDVYFFGWVLFELFFGRKYEKGIESENFKFLEAPDSSNKKKTFKLLIRKSLDPNPEIRPSFYELLVEFTKLLKINVDYEIITQMKGESLSLLMNKFKLTQADLMKYSDSLGRKLVHEYCIYNNLEGLKELTSIIGKECLNVVDKYNCTCAHFASRNGNIEMLQFLLENGFNKWNEKEKRFNLFPLSLTTLMKHNHCLEFLSSQSNIDCLNESLIYASQEGNLDHVKLFLEKGAYVNFVSPDLNRNSLYLASRNGHLEIVKELIKNKADVNLGRVGNSCSALIIASEHGHLEIVKELLNNHANVNQGRTNNGCTPLYMASRNGYLEIVKELIDNGANLNQARTDNGATPLYIASEKRNFEIVRELINNGANLNQTTQTGTTPLYIACQSGNLEIVLDLIANGANINQAITDNGYTPLYIACSKGHLEIVKELLNKVANVNQATTNNNYIPLFIACSKGHLLIVKELLTKGANVNLATTDVGYTPLYSACKKGHFLIAKELLNNGANVNQATTDNNYTPLYIASQNGHFEIVKELIAKGANVNQGRTNDGATPLYIASENGHLEIVKELINNGANLQQETNKLRKTPLYIACEKGHFLVVKELIKRGSIIDHIAEDGNTPLCISYLKEHFQIVKELITNGAKVNQERIDGSTPLYMACSNGHLEIVKELINNGANLNQTTKDGETPLFIACEKGYLEIVKELVQKGAQKNLVCQVEYKHISKKTGRTNSITEIKRLSFDDNCKWSLTPIYVAWLNDKREIISFLKDISDIQFNIQLAKQNNHYQASKFFKSLQKSHKKS